MLIGIDRGAGAECALILLHPADTVAVARVAIAPGVEVRAGDWVVRALDPIGPGHKIALREIRRGESVLRYGEVIGRAREDIPAGRHVHTHNLSFEAPKLEYEFPATEQKAREPLPNAPAFMGYPRANPVSGSSEESGCASPSSLACCQV